MSEGQTTPNEVFETRVSKIWLNERGIVHSVVHPKAEINGADAREGLAITAKLGQGRPVPVLADISGIRSVTAKARDCYSQKQATDALAAMALLVSSPISKVVGNFFIGLNKPPFPVKLFTSESDAFDWLLGLSK